MFLGQLVRSCLTGHFVFSTTKTRKTRKIISTEYMAWSHLNMSRVKNFETWRRFRFGVAVMKWVD